MKKSGCEIISSDHGFIVWRVVGTEAEIITIGVHPEHRSAGIAAAILALAENDMKKSGAESIFLEVAADNRPARKLYENQGYVQIGLRPKYYAGVDAIIMKKVL
ncbi:MAG: GNAT family N-acetyltransferase [Rickettsiales bacterium]|nr:GNAT family N-acetyltransferase [Rickettsiales bacterium]